MAVFSNEIPTPWTNGCDFVQIEDEEFTVVSEPQGLIAVLADNDQGYLTIDAAKRLVRVLEFAISNSTAPTPIIETTPAADGKHDDELPF